jgi:hypothetical protein
MTNFKEQYINGKIDITKIDEHVEEWHQKKPQISLQEYLGLDDEEFAAFLLGESKLKKLLDQKIKYESAGSFLSRVKNCT